MVDPLEVNLMEIVVWALVVTIGCKDSLSSNGMLGHSNQDRREVLETDEKIRRSGRKIVKAK